jgi:hypothetical protein
MGMKQSKGLCLGLTSVFCLVVAASGCGSQASGPPGTTVALVQVENSGDSDPHAGLQAADVVYEYVAEGGISRFTVVYFDPSRPSRIGPVRSIRPVSLKIRESYEGAIFFAGGSQPMMSQVHSQHVPAMSEQDNGDVYFHRDSSRFAPHNLFTSGSDLQTALGRVSGTKTFYPASPGSPAAEGTPISQISFAQTASHHVAYSYDKGTYAYSSERGVLVDSDEQSRQLQATNVVVLFIASRPYGATDTLGAQVVDFDLTAGGDAQLFSGGKSYKAQWQPFTNGSGLRLRSTDGRDFQLRAGLTWVHLVEPGTTITSSA